MRAGLAAAGLALIACACNRPVPPGDRPVAPPPPRPVAAAPPAVSGDADADLGRLNREYSGLLAQAIRSPVLTPTTRGQLMDAQVAFARRRAACGASPGGDACLIAAYTARIAELRAYVPDVN